MSRRRVFVAGGAALFLAALSLGASAAPQGEGCPGRMTGGGSVFTADGVRVTHGFELHCNKDAGSNNLEVNWEKKNFHLTSLDASHPISCTPTAGFDTIEGWGTGTLNGVPGATIHFTFTDVAEPGKGHDTATIKINGGSTLDVSGPLESGNHQAHP